MTAISNEARQRLQAIEHGPWADRLVSARRNFAPVDNLELPVSSGESIVIDEIPLSGANLRCNQQLSIVLRLHYEDENGITSSEEIKMRDAFDDALTLPQLYELAVQTGYLPLDTVREPARKILTELLWSPAARAYVDGYDYITVPMLAARVGIKWVGMPSPLEINPESALRFAGFLAHIREFHTDEQIGVWIRFLDDYIDEDQEQNKVWNYLIGKEKTPPKRIMKLLSGCQMFVASLASVFNILDYDELGRFGLIHAYWLQKFFGYKKFAGGFVKDIATWGTDGSWAHMVMTSQQLVPSGIDEDIAEVCQRRFSAQVQLLERTFRAIQDLVKASNSNKPTIITPSPTFHS